MESRALGCRVISIQLSVLYLKLASTFQRKRHIEENILVIEPLVLQMMIEDRMTALYRVANDI